MVKIEGLFFAYKKGFPIFQDFNWNIAPGERWAVIGPSGCGKTTLLYLLAGLREPDSGQIAIEDSRSNGHRPAAGLILQDYGLFPWATALDNVAIGLKIRGIEKGRISEIAHQWMRQLGIDSVSDHYPGELSGGQRQRVAIARTLALQPGLLLMDEPFASLDALTREDLLDLIMLLWKDFSSTMVLVTHNIEEAVHWGSQILVLHQPPNREPIIIDNPESGHDWYRESEIFRSRCRQLRNAVGENAGNKPGGGL
jgi:ABC-type nitrate/sulfonate/bicarbonate transport system ATPase subunit